MADLVTIVSEVQALEDLCRRTQALVAAGPTIPSSTIAELEAEASMVIAGMTAELDALRAVLVERDAELEHLVSEHEAACLLLARAIPLDRRIALAELVTAHSDRRAAAGAGTTGR